MFQFLIVLFDNPQKVKLQKRRNVGFMIKWYLCSIKKKTLHNLNTGLNLFVIAYLTFVMTLP